MRQTTMHMGRGSVVGILAAAVVMALLACNETIGYQNYDGDRDQWFAEEELAMEDETGDLADEAGDDPADTDQADVDPTDLTDTDAGDDPTDIDLTDTDITDITDTDLTDTDITDITDIDTDTADQWPELDLDVDTGGLVTCPTGNEPGPVMTVTPDMVDFGVVASGNLRTQQVRVCNTGHALFSLNSVSLARGSSAAFTLSHDAVPRNLPPGYGMVVTVLYAPTDQLWHQGFMDLVSTSSRPLVEVELSGGQRPLGQMGVNPSILGFVEAAAGTATITLNSLGPGSLTITSLAIPSPYFTITAVGSGGVGDGPWLLPMGQGLAVKIAYNGDSRASDTTLDIAWYNGAETIDTHIIIQVGGTELCAVPDAGPDQEVTATMTVWLDGTASWDPNDAPVANEAWYKWDFVSKPPDATGAILTSNTGASIAGVWTTDDKPSFLAELPGTYVISLRVNASDDQGCAAMDTVTIEAAEGDSITLNLSWNVSSNDHDLHLIRYQTDSFTGPGCFSRGESTNIDDCHWTNCKAYEGGFPTTCPARGCPGPTNAPDWAVLNLRADDAVMQADDINGMGPEIITFSQPEPGRYWVAVERYSGSAAPTLTLKVYVRSRLAATYTGSIAATSYHWNVCFIDVDDNGDISLTPIGVTKSSAAKDCAPSVP